MCVCVCVYVCVLTLIHASGCADLRHVEFGKNNETEKRRKGEGGGERNERVEREKGRYMEIYVQEVLLVNTPHLNLFSSFLSPSSPSPSLSSLSCLSSPSSTASSSSSSLSYPPSATSSSLSTPPISPSFSSSLSSSSSLRKLRCAKLDSLSDSSLTLITGTLLSSLNSQ